MNSSIKKALLKTSTAIQRRTSAHLFERPPAMEKSPAFAMEFIIAFEG
jgi:hypothetical protein